jgi:hypothetical protein
MVEVDVDSGITVMLVDVLIEKVVKFSTSVLVAVGVAWQAMSPEERS